MAGDEVSKGRHRDLSDVAATCREDPGFDRAIVEEILERVDAKPTPDDRSPDEILGYDEHGMPH